MDTFIYINYMIKINFGKKKTELDGIVKNIHCI